MNKWKITRGGSHVLIFTRRDTLFGNLWIGHLQEVKSIHNIIENKQKSCTASQKGIKRGKLLFWFL